MMTLRWAIPAALLAVSTIVMMGPAKAAKWQATPADPVSVDLALFDEIGAPAPNGLPDGLVVRADGGDIRAAWYEQPTERYRHAILGDGIEAGALAIERSDGTILHHVLNDIHVFEDRTPRLADLDLDGRTEVVTILSSLIDGGSIAVFGLNDAGAIELKAIAGSIGRANRWLNVAALEDLLGSGDRQIAYVETPHIGGTLYLYRYASGALSQVARMRGFSNHAIGAREQRLSATADVDGDGLLELAVPSANRRTLRIVGVRDGSLVEKATVPLPGRVRTAIVPMDSSLGPAFQMGLEDGTFVTVHR